MTEALREAAVALGATISTPYTDAKRWEQHVVRRNYIRSRQQARYVHKAVHCTDSAVARHYHALYEWGRR